MFSDSKPCGPLFFALCLTNAHFLYSCSIWRFNNISLLYYFHLVQLCLILVSVVCVVKDYASKDKRDDLFLDSDNVIQKLHSSKIKSGLSFTESKSTVERSLSITKSQCFTQCVKVFIVSQRASHYPYFYSEAIPFYHFPFSNQIFIHSIYRIHPLASWIILAKWITWMPDLTLLRGLITFVL